MPSTQLAIARTILIAAPVTTVVRQSNVLIDLSSRCSTCRLCHAKGRATRSALSMLWKLEVFDEGRSVSPGCGVSSSPVARQMAEESRLVLYPRSRQARRRGLPVH